MSATTLLVADNCQIFLGFTKIFFLTSASDRTRTRAGGSGLALVSLSAAAPSAGLGGAGLAGKAPGAGGGVCDQYTAGTA